MITLLLTFAVSGSVFAAQSLVVAARADNSRLGTAIGAAKSAARAMKASAVTLSEAIKANAPFAQPTGAVSAVERSIVTVKPVAPKTAARRKACTLKV